MLVTVGNVTATAGIFTLDIVVAVVVTDGFGALWLADNTKTMFPLVVVGAVMVTVCIGAVFGAATVTVCFGIVVPDNDARAAFATANTGPKTPGPRAPGGSEAAVVTD